MSIPGTEALQAQFAAPQQRPAGPLVGRCPEIPPGVEAYCWKFLNPDPAAVWDFWLIKSFIQSPQDKSTVMASMLVPAQNGDLVSITTTVEHRRLSGVNAVKVLKASHGSFGPVSVAKMKVKEHFDGSMRDVYRVENDIFRFSKDGKLLDFQRRKAPNVPLILDPGAPPKGASALGLAPGMAPTERAGELSLRHSQLQPFIDPGAYRIYFPKATPIVNAAGLVVDFDVDGGHLLKRPQLFAAAPAAEGDAPGVYIEIATQDGDPPLNVMVVYVITDTGEQHRLISRMCTGVTGTSFYEKVVVKKESSWFKKRTKIVRVVKEFTLDDMTCSVEHTPISP